MLPTAPAAQLRAGQGARGEARGQGAAGPPPLRPHSPLLATAAPSSARTRPGGQAREAGSGWRVAGRAGQGRAGGGRAGPRPPRLPLRSDRGSQPRWRPGAVLPAASGKEPPYFRGERTSRPGGCLPSAPPARPVMAAVWGCRKGGAGLCLALWVLSRPLSSQKSPLSGHES